MNDRKPSFWVGSWYFVVTIGSVGLLAWVPFVHAARRLRRRSIVIMAAIYAAAAVTAVVLISQTPTDTADLTGTDEVKAILADLLLLSLVIAGCVQQVWLRRQVYRRTDATDPALATARRGRDRRTAARTLIANDPLIARELRIGRPDLPRTYDDGGLVDLNSAPATAIATICDLTAQTADNIVAARTACGGFFTVDDVFSLADIPIDTWDLIRDRGFIISPQTSH